MELICTGLKMSHIFQCESPIFITVAYVVSALRNQARVLWTILSSVLEIYRTDALQ